MEAARCAAEVGYGVALFEGRDVVGGVVGDAAHPPAKRRIAGFLHHLDRRAARVGIDVRAQAGGAPSAADTELFAPTQMVEMLDKEKVDIRTLIPLLEVKDDSVVVSQPDGSTVELPFDTGFVCLGMRAVDAPYRELAERVIATGVEVLIIGDSAGVGRIIDAASGGRDLLLALERAGVLPFTSAHAGTR
jgi:hypothetical protein